MIENLISFTNCALHIRGKVIKNLMSFTTFILFISRRIFENVISFTIVMVLISSRVDWKRYHLQHLCFLSQAQWLKTAFTWNLCAFNLKKNNWKTYSIYNLIRIPYVIYKVCGFYLKKMIKNFILITFSVLLIARKSYWKSIIFLFSLGCSCFGGSGSRRWIFH